MLLKFDHTKTEEQSKIYLAIELMNQDNSNT